MTITLNGDARQIGEVGSVTELLDELGFGAAPVLVELNGKALYQREFAAAPVADGDRVEIIRIVAGG